VNSGPLTARWNSPPTEPASTRQKAGGRRSWRFFRSENRVKLRLLRSGRHERCRLPKCELPLRPLKRVIASEVGGHTGIGGSVFWTRPTSPCWPTAPNGSGKNNYLHYAVRLAAGLSNGSGQIEGACKNLIGRRLKQTGARWKVHRLNRMAGLCSIMYSDLWKTYWNAT